MRSRTLVIVVIVVALFVTATLAMRGEGHNRLVSWMSAMHGR